MMEYATTVTIIGPGALGGALVNLINTHPQFFILHSVWGRKKKDCYFRSGSDQIPADTTFPTGESDLGKLIFITVPDDNIHLIADQLSRLSLHWNRHSVVHFSGSHSSDLLGAISKKGSAVASLHPLQTFTNEDSATRFKDIWFTLEGNESLFPALELLVQKAGANSIRMDTDQKKAMHLAAVFASNYLVALMSAVEQVTETERIEQAVEMMKPLILQTLDNIFEKGTANSLSGPILRGDLSTLQSHLHLMKNQPDLQLLYKHLGIQALRLADQSKHLKQNDSDAIRAILSIDEI